MIEKLIDRGSSPISVMRALAVDFDNGIAITGSEGTQSISCGIPITILGEKARVIEGASFILTTSRTPYSSDLLEQENMQLRNENIMLKNVINRIDHRLAEIEAALPDEKVIMLREISKEQAKKEISALFKQGKILYYSDIAEYLGLELQLVVEICNELQSKGEIEIADDTLQSR